MSEKCILSLLSGRVESLGTDTSASSQAGSGLDFGTTFNLGLTQRQKESREDLVLPHFSAQRIQPSENATGEIEYTLDADDDFDDEEDVDEDLLI